MPREPCRAGLWTVSGGVVQRPLRPGFLRGRWTQAGLTSGLCGPGAALGVRGQEGREGDPTPLPAFLPRQEQENVLQRVLQLPVVSGTCECVQKTYASTKEAHPLVASVCSAYEKGVQGASSLAAWSMEPVVRRLSTQCESSWRVGRPPPHACPLPACQSVCPAVRLSDRLTACCSVCLSVCLTLLSLLL